MKKLFLAVITLFWFTSVFAQKELLQFDENNKYVYYQVAEKPGMNADTLESRAMLFIKKNGFKQFTKGSAANSLLVKDKFVIYNSSLASKKQAGEIVYALNIDSKDEKYRYKFGSFVFTPYKIDRYGNMVAVPGIEVPLERMSVKYSKKDVDSYMEQLATLCKDTAEQLKRYIDRVQVVEKPEPVKKVATDKW